MRAGSLSRSDLMRSCHGAGIKMVQWFWKALPASEPCGLSSHTSLPTYSARQCLHSTHSRCALFFLLKTQKPGQNVPQGWTPVQQEGMLFGRSSSNLWPRLLGRACSWSPGAAPGTEKLTGEFAVRASHKLTWSPDPNPRESCMSRPSDTGSVPKVSMPKQGQYVLLCYGCVFLHGLQVGCLFVFGLPPCPVRVKASIKQLLSCLLILLLEAAIKSKSQQLQTRALKSPNPCVLWYRNDWLLHSPPQATFYSTMSMCVIWRLVCGL